MDTGCNLEDLPGVIGDSAKRESGNSLLSARLDDYIYIYIYIYVCVCVRVYYCLIFITFNAFRE